MKSLIISLPILLGSITLFAQKNDLLPNNYQSIGVNLLGVLDNTYELSYKNQFRNHLRADITVGGSNNTRELNYGYLFTEPASNILSEKREGNITTTIDRYNNNWKTSGVYAKASVVGIINLFTNVYGPHQTTIQLYVGPCLGISTFSQKADNVTRTTVTTVTRINDSNNYKSDITTTKETLIENKTILGSGYSIGLSIVNKRRINADIGADFVGFRRKTNFTNTPNTPGLGNRFLIRLNYNL
jgi:hypothetical protein